jgi:hemerythrin-like domain-containing protein
MDAINTLMNEHRLIEKVLGALGGYMEALTSNGEADRAELARFADFFSGFADAFHHAREEDILFEVMSQNGFPKTSGPLAVMLADHEQNRKFVAVLREAGTKGNADWTSDEINEVVVAAGSYTYLLEGHIQKEDGILYPMAQERLPEEVMEDIHAQFKAAAIDPNRQAEDQRLRALADELCAVYTPAE